jgi:hypothetical protein
MKTLIFSVYILITSMSLAQGSDINLDGNLFTGTASEITSPDVDRMPMVLNESISFSEGKINSDVLKIYSADNCKYTAITDDRRMIAMKVVNVQYNSEGIIDGKNVTIVFNGNIIGDKMLSGNLTVKYPDNSEVNFSIIAEKN